MDDSKKLHTNVLMHKMNEMNWQFFWASEVFYILIDKQLQFLWLTTL